MLKHFRFFKEFLRIFQEFAVDFRIIPRSSRILKKYGMAESCKEFSRFFFQKFQELLGF
jgi:hypothetical protein